MNKLLIYSEKPYKYHQYIQEKKLDDLTIYATYNQLHAEELAPLCNILLGEPQTLAKIMPSCFNLQWAQSTYAGVDLLCKEGMPRDYKLTGVKDIFGPLMSEYVIGQIIARERHFFDLKENEYSRQWQRSYYRPLSQLKIGICGLGSIGSHVAKTCSYFDMNVSGYCRSPKEIPSVKSLYHGDQFDQFLENLDYLLLALPDTPETRGMINKSVFEKLPHEAVVINIGRGKTVNEYDLIEAVKHCEISGAILDVFENEPLSENSPLWNMGNVTLTPHVSAISFPEDIAEIFARNYQKFQNKESLDYLVDFERGY